MARRALLIANGSFRHEGIASLKSPVPDANRLAELLRREDVGGFDVDVAEDLNSAELRKRVLRFFNGAGAGDQTILFFSGHGDKNSDGHLYLNTADTEPDLLEATAVPARFVIDRAQKSLSKQTLFFIDCCYSGAFAASLGVKAGGQSETQPLSRDDFAVAGARGMAIMTASAGLQPARELALNGRIESLFTRHLIDGISTGAAASAMSGTISVANLFHYVRDQLRQDGAKQEPRNFLFGLDGSEPVALNPAKRTNPLPPELLAQCEQERWQERQMAATELAGLAQQDALVRPFAVVDLRKLAKDPDDRVKQFARRYLQALGEEIEEPKPDDLNLRRRNMARDEPPSEESNGPFKTENGWLISGAFVVVWLLWWVIGSTIYVSLYLPRAEPTIEACATTGICP